MMNPLFFKAAPETLSSIVFPVLGSPLNIYYVADTPFYQYKMIIIRNTLK